MEMNEIPCLYLELRSMEERQRVVCGEREKNIEERYCRYAEA